MAAIAITDAAQAQLEALPLRIQGRVEGIVERLEKWPQVSGAKPLKHGRKGSYRIRTGDYRIIFFVEGDTIVITQVGHRKDDCEG